jgi:hypothetical protein
VQADARDAGYSGDSRNAGHGDSGHSGHGDSRAGWKLDGDPGDAVYGDSGYAGDAWISGKSGDGVSGTAEGDFECAGGSGSGGDRAVRCGESGSVKVRARTI